jgi:hypothetical protein
VTLRSVQGDLLQYTDAAVASDSVQCVALYSSLNAPECIATDRRR